MRLRHVMTTRSGLSRWAAATSAYLPGATRKRIPAFKEAVLLKQHLAISNATGKLSNATGKLRSLRGHGAGHSSHRSVRLARAAMAGAVVIAGLAVAPQAHADGGVGINSLYAFQASDTGLVVNDNGNTTPTGLGMMPGTHPSVSALGSGAFVAAIEANTSVLWIAGADGTGPIGLPMWPGTSPSITIMRNGMWAIAFQGSDGNLKVTNQGNPSNPVTYGPMNHQSSPTITEEPLGNVEVAYESASNELMLAGDVQEPTGLFMRPGTSPSIMTPGFVPAGHNGYEVAYQSPSGTMAITGTLITEDTGQPMNTASSPAITTDPANGNGYEVAYESSGNTLATWGTIDGGGDTGFPMAPGTGPSITGARSNGEIVAFHSSDGTLHIYDSRETGDFGPQDDPTFQGMNGGSNPSSTSWGS